jgi:melanoma-associated antigen p97
MRCNLGKVKANAMMARGGLGFNRTEIDAYINVFMYAQQFYGLKGKQRNFNGIGLKVNLMLR